MGFYAATATDATPVSSRQASRPASSDSPKTLTPVSRSKKLGRRLYSANLSRWLSRDLIAELGGLNICVYVANDPVDRIDLFGLADVFGIQVLLPPQAREGKTCGGCESKVKWLINASQSGYIVQHVQWEYDVKDCAGNPIEVAPNDSTPVHEYWEAWQVDSGDVYGGRRQLGGGNPHQSDNFSTRDMGECTKGRITITGRVKFWKDYALGGQSWADPLSPQHVPACGAAVTLRFWPEGWDESDASDHTLTCEWNCCHGQRQTSTASGTP